MNRIQPDTSLPKEKQILTLAGILNQEGTAAPTIEILQNTTKSTINLTRFGAGTYLLNLTEYAGDIQGITIVQTPAFDENVRYTGRPNLYNQVKIVTIDQVTGLPADDCLYNAPFKMEIYNQ